MFGERASSNKKSQSVIRVPSAHEDLVFTAIQHVTQLTERAIDGHDNKLSSQETYAIRATAGWDSSQYNAARSALRDSIKPVMSEFAQQLKCYWLESKEISIESNDKAYTAFGFFGEDESMLAMKLEARGVTERLRDRYIGVVSDLKDKINILLGRTVFQFERCPFDVSHLVYGFFNSLQCSKLNTRHKLMVLKFFELRVGHNLGGFYSKINSTLKKKIEQAEKLLSDDLLDDWIDDELFNDKTKTPEPKRPEPIAPEETRKKRASKSPTLRVDHYRLLSLVNSLSQKIRNIDAPGPSRSVRENLMSEIRRSGGSTVAFSSRCEKAMRYVDSKTMSFRSARSPSIASGIQMKLQLVLLKYTLNEDQFVENRYPNLRALIDYLSGLANRRCPSSLLKVVHACLDKLLSVTDVKDSYCGKVVTSIRQKAKDLSDSSPAVKVPEDDSLSDAIRQFLRKSLPENSPKLLRFLVKRLWYQRLYAIAIREGKRSEAWQVQVERLNTLVWSMQRCHQDARLLRSKLPSVFASVKENIQYMDWQDNTGDLLMEKLNDFFARRISESVAIEVEKNFNQRKSKPNSIF